MGWVACEGVGGVSARASPPRLLIRCLLVPCHAMKCHRRHASAPANAACWIHHSHRRLGQLLPPHPRLPPHSVRRCLAGSVSSTTAPQRWRASRTMAWARLCGGGAPPPPATAPSGTTAAASSHRSSLALTTERRCAAALCADRSATGCTCALAVRATGAAVGVPADRGLETLYRPLRSEESLCGWCLPADHHQARLGAELGRLPRGTALV